MYLEEISYEAEQIEASSKKKSRKGGKFGKTDKSKNAHKPSKNWQGKDISNASEKDLFDMFGGSSVGTGKK